MNKSLSEILRLYIALDCVWTGTACTDGCNVCNSVFRLKLLWGESAL